MSSLLFRTREVPAHPGRCPVCDSGQITANAIKDKSSAYWRCLVCGIVWHPSRLPLVARTGARPR
jgi:hypothetical protein